MSANPASPAARLPRLRVAPPLSGATGWVNSGPLTPEALRGRVVLYAFCTYTCINWLRTLPHVRAWAAKYRDDGLTVVGVHTPEFTFEQEPDNVRPALRSHGIEFPVALDSDYTIWRAFDNNYWPAFYLVDVDGAVRYTHFGEGRYAETEGAIQQLVVEAGRAGGTGDLVSVEGTGDEAPADWGELESSETYFGSGRAESFASPGGLHPGGPHRYELPPQVPPSSWALSGVWTVRRDRITAAGPGAALLTRFHARDLHVVMAPAQRGAPVRFAVRLDGRPPAAGHGLDVDPAGSGVVREPRMYQLIRQPLPITDRSAEISFPDGGADAFVMTFG